MDYHSQKCFVEFYLGEDEEPGDVILNCAELLMLSSLGVLSTVIFGMPPWHALPIRTSTERER